MAESFPRPVFDALDDRLKCHRERAKINGLQQPVRVELRTTLDDVQNEGRVALIDEQTANELFDVHLRETRESKTRQTNTWAHSPGPNGPGVKDRLDY